MESEQKQDTWTRLLGLAVFLLGIALMVLVFVWAARLFNELGVGKDLALKSNPTDQTPLAEWGVRWLMRVLLLFALGYIASLIAARGANFYLAARSQQRMRGDE